MSGIEETTTRDFWPHVVLDIITVSLLANLYRKELVISDAMLIPNECLTLGQGECLSGETTASAITPRLAVWLSPPDLLFGSPQGDTEPIICQTMSGESNDKLA